MVVYMFRFRHVRFLYANNLHKILKKKNFAYNSFCSITKKTRDCMEYAEYE